MIIGIDASRAVTTQRTGTEAYAYFLIRALIPLAEAQGLRLRLYFNEPPPVGLFPTSAAVESVVIPWRRMWTHMRLGRELGQNPPDIFFTPAHVIPATYRGRSVATVHDLGYHYFPEAHTRRQRTYLQWSTRHNCRRSYQIIADSATTKHDLTRFYDVDPDNVVVVYPGIDPDLAPITDTEKISTALHKYGINPPYLIYIGTLQPRKNLERLVRAYAESGVNHKLVLAGKKGWLSQPILESIWQLPLQLQQQIVLPGFVNEVDKAALISGATALLYPSLYEGFGFPVLEAQVCGTAVLASNTSSLPEIVGAGALLVDPLETKQISSALSQLVEDDMLCTNLQTEGRINAARFTWQRTAVAILNVLTGD